MLPKTDRDIHAPLPGKRERDVSQPPAPTGPKLPTVSDTSTSIRSQQFGRATGAQLAVTMRAEPAPSRKAITAARQPASLR